MANDFITKIRRAERTTVLFAQIYAASLAKAVHTGDTGHEKLVNEQFGSVLIDYVDKGVNIADTAGNLKRNPFAAFGLIGMLSGDPFADELGRLRTFCQVWADYSGVKLTADDQELLKFPNAG